MNSRRGGVNAPGPTANIESQGGGWETIEKKSKKSGQAAGKQWPQWGSSSNAAPKAWGQSEGAARQAWGANGSSSSSGNNGVQPADRRPAGRGNPRPLPQTKAWEAEYQAPRQVAPPLANGWQWASRPRPSGSESKRDKLPSYDHENVSDDDDDDDNDVSDDEMTDEYDSDASEKSFETRKKSKCFKGFFEALDKLTVEEINEQTRQWHCPACQNGPGAIDWYRLQPLMTHAKTKGAKRVRLHRELAALLEEELSRRGTSVIPAGEQFGKWKGLTTADHEIVWPPMVIVMNTLLDKDDNDNKWIGMGNQELLDYFKEYSANKARHAYGPQGHRGMSVLIFESSAMGYMEAERLHKHFKDHGTNRDAWQCRNKNLFLPGGKRQLFGFMATKEDMEMFNRHCQGKSRLKYDIKSYHENVLVPMKQMSEDNQQLNYFKNKVVKTEQRSKTLEKTMGDVTQKLRETMEENRIVRQRTKQQHEEHKEEMDFQERFFKDQIERVHQATEEKERMFEKLLQEERAKARQSNVQFGTSEDCKLRKKEIQMFIDCQVKGVEEFEVERDELIKAHEDKKLKLKKEYMEKEVKLEEEFDAALTALMEKYKPDAFQASSS